MNIKERQRQRRRDEEEAHNNEARNAEAVRESGPGPEIPAAPDEANTAPPNAVLDQIVKERWGLDNNLMTQDCNGIFTTYQINYPIFAIEFGDMLDFFIRQVSRAMLFTNVFKVIGDVKLIERARILQACGNLPNQSAWLRLWAGHDE